MGLPMGGTQGGTWQGGYPTLGTPLPHQTWPGGIPMGGIPPWVSPLSDLAGGVPLPGVYPTSSSTWYAAVGMPLAFRQEDFLV